MMKVGATGGQFAWNESRPDGRRAIENHQKAHARGIRNAHKVVDTSMPKFFKIRLNRGREKAGGQVEPGAFGAGLLDTGVGSGMGGSAPGMRASIASRGARLDSRGSGGERGSLTDAGLFARFGGMATNPRLNTDQGVPIPNASTKSIISRSRTPSPIPDESALIANATAVTPPVGHAFNASSATPSPSRAGALHGRLATTATSPPVLSPADRLTNGFDSQQLHAYEAFVDLLRSMHPQDMHLVAATAVQDAQDGLLFSQYGL